MCLYNMLKCWRSMRVGREKFIEIRSQLSFSFIRTYTMHKPETIYTSWKYDFWIVAPLIFIVLAGCVLSYVVQLLDMGICPFRHFTRVWGFLSAPGISLVLVPIISWYHFKQKNVPVRDALIRWNYAEQRHPLSSGASVVAI